MDEYLTKIAILEKNIEIKIRTETHLEQLLIEKKQNITYIKNDIENLESETIKLQQKLEEVISCQDFYNITKVNITKKYLIIELIIILIGELLFRGIPVLQPFSKILILDVPLLSFVVAGGMANYFFKTSLRRKLVKNNDVIDIFNLINRTIEKQFDNKDTIKILEFEVEDIQTQILRYKTEKELLIEELNKTKLIYENAKELIFKDVIEMTLSVDEQIMTSEEPSKCYQMKEFNVE